MIESKDVEYIAHLSRIHLQPDEIPALTKNLEDILGYVKKLETLDVSNVKPTTHVISMQDVFRKDQVVKPFTQDEATSFAIQKSNGAFKVPKVIE